jgi:hypothetical protein
MYNGSTSPDDGGYGAKVMAERGRLRDAARGRNVQINAPQAPTTTTASTAGTQKVASVSMGANGEKRVRMTLDGAHPLMEKTSASSSPSQDDASTGGAAAQKHQPELGA